MDNLNVTKYDKGVAKCPFNPHANITTLITESGQMFVGSPTDFSGSDPAILRADVSQVNTPRTETINFNELLSKYFLVFLGGQRHSSHEPVQLEVAERSTICW